MEKNTGTATCIKLDFLGKIVYDEKKAARYAEKKRLGREKKEQKIRERLQQNQPTILDETNGFKLRNQVT